MSMKDNLLEIMTRIDTQHDLLEFPEGLGAMVLFAAIAEGEGYSRLEERIYSTGAFLGLLLGIGYVMEYGVPEIAKGLFTVRG